LNPFSFIRDVATRQIPVLLYTVFPLIWISILLLLSAYDQRRYPRLGDEMFILAVGALLAGLSMAGALYLSFREISRILFLVFVALGLSFQFAWRAVLRLVLRPVVEDNRQLRRVLVVGSGELGEKLRQEIQNFAGLEFAGFLASATQPHGTDRLVLGSLEDAERVIAQQEINDVVLALPLSLHAHTNELLKTLHELPVRVWLVPDSLGIAMQQAGLGEFAGLPMLDLRVPVLNEYQRGMKRAFDLAITLFVLPWALMLMGVIALAIRLEGKGPIFFRQTRVGENGRLFEMLKFRSMVPNATELSHLVEHRDAAGNLVHKTPHDPRVTRVGRFLRRSSLDELPQLFNILRGDMSLVGPRPELPHLVEKYQPWQWRRFAVPQGMTGWWQVNGRSDRPMHMNTEDDLYYIRHYSLALDIWILVRTISAVTRGKGAF
jgi:exopolysaccharide biosynthesis polyprenyl glycosylphosphotransferase